MPALDAGAVDQNVQLSAQKIQGLLKGLFQLGEGGEVADHAVISEPLLVVLFHHLVHLVRSGNGNHLYTGLQEAFQDTAAKSAGGAGDDGFLPVTSNKFIVESPACP